ncbi:MAG: TM2 domain-containing protein [Bacteroidota bacterium]
MSAEMISMLPGIQPEEFVLLQNLTKNMTDTQQRQLLSLYASKRKDPQGLLILAIIGFFGVAGIQRFVVGQTGMGLLYLFTLGFCFIGTIMDVVNIKSIAAEYNQKQALESATMVSMMK